MQYLRTNTAVIVAVGPFLDKADGVTLETGLTITNERISLIAETDAGSAPTFVLDNVTGATSGTNNDLNYITGQDNAMMQLELSAANTNRLGRMRLTITDAANHCPVFHDYTVLPADIYDQMFTANANRGVIIAAGTIGSTGNSTTALHLTGLTYGDDELNNMLIVIKDVSAGERHARWITDWADTGDLATVATLPFTPENAVDTYEVLAIRQDVTGGSGLDAAGVRSALGMASANLDTQLAAIDDAIDTEVAAILADTNELQTDWANGGRLDLILDARASQTSVDTIDTEIGVIDGIVDSILVDTAEIGVAGAGLTEAGGTGDHLTALATQASVDTIDNFLDTEITAIMNRLPAALTADGNMKADILRVVGIAIQAAGGGTSAVGEV